MFAALGLHPIVIEQHSDDCLEQLQQALDKRPQKLVAVGEIGLDLYRDDPQFDKQERLLEAQLAGEALRAAGDPAFAAHS